MSEPKTCIGLCPILTPTDWTPENDFKCYQVRWGEPDGEYFSEALDRVAESCEFLIAVVDRALVYFQRKDSRLLPVHPGTLPVSEKLARLSAITNTRNANAHYKICFAVHLHSAISADNERRSVLEAHHLGEGRSWLYPLCQLADRLMDAAAPLEEAMASEHDDYYGTLFQPVGGQ